MAFDEFANRRLKPWQFPVFSYFEETEENKGKPKELFEIRQINEATVTNYAYSGIAKIEKYLEDK